MENYDLMLGLGAPLTSAVRSLSPSILGKHQAQTMPMNLSDLMPQEPQLGGLASLEQMGKMMMGPFSPMNRRKSGIVSMLGGI